MDTLQEAGQNPQIVVPLDAAGRIDADVACIHCGYNLRTSTTDGVCPECGRKVVESLRFGGAGVRRWLARVKTVLAIQLVCIVLGSAAGIILTVPGAHHHSMPLLSGVFCGLPVLAVVCASILAAITETSPSSMVRDESRAARLLVRVGLLMLFGAAASVAVAWASPRPPPSHVSVGLIAAIVSGVLFGLSAFGVLPIGGLCYLAVLMRYLYRMDMESRCRRMCWLIAVGDLLFTGIGLLDGVMKSRLSQSWHDFFDLAPLALVVPFMLGAAVLLQVWGVLRRVSKME